MFLSISNLLNYLVITCMSFAYIWYYGIGIDISNIEKIFDRQNTLDIHLVEFVFNNFAFFTSFMNLNSAQSIIILQIIGLLFLILGTKRYFPNVFLIIILLIPNLYLSSFSTIQMSFLIGLTLIGLTEKYLYKQVAVGFFCVLFHWFAIISFTLVLLSNCSLKTLLILSSAVLITLSPEFLKFIIFLSELIVGGTRYSNVFMSFNNLNFNYNLLILFLLNGAYFGLTYFFNWNFSWLTRNIKFLILLAALFVILFIANADLTIIFRILNLAVIPALFVLTREVRYGRNLTTYLMSLLLTVNFVIKVF